jgi:riboflavin synthase
MSEAKQAYMVCALAEAAGLNRFYSNGELRLIRVSVHDTEAEADEKAASEASRSYPMAVIKVFVHENY